MNIEEIDKWLDDEYGVSYTRLEELHDFLIEQNMKYQDKIDNLQQENKQLKEDIKILFKENENKEKVIILQDNIIKEARKYINNASYFDGSSMCANDLLEILGDKENE